MAGKGGGGKPVKGRNDERPNAKAWKKSVRVFDTAVRRLVKKPHPKA